MTTLYPCKVDPTVFAADAGAGGTDSDIVPLLLRMRDGRSRGGGFACRSCCAVVDLGRLVRSISIFHSAMFFWLFSLKGFISHLYSVTLLPFFSCFCSCSCCNGWTGPSSTERRLNPLGAKSVPRLMPSCGHHTDKTEEMHSFICPVLGL